MKTACWFTVGVVVVDGGAVTVVVTTGKVAVEVTVEVAPGKVEVEVTVEVSVVPGSVEMAVDVVMHVTVAVVEGFAAYTAAAPMIRPPAAAAPTFKNVLREGLESPMDSCFSYKLYKKRGM